MTITFWKSLFLAAGIYGVAIVAPLFFLEKLLGEHYPPAITHPEFYYGFVCVTLAWQVVYLMMWRDPLRLRPVLIPAMAGKAGFAIAVVVQFTQQRVQAASVALAAIDLTLATLFAWAFIDLGRQQGPDQEPSLSASHAGSCK